MAGGFNAKRGCRASFSFEVWSFRSQRIQPLGVLRAALALLLVAIALPVAAESDQLVPELEQRLATGGVDKVNVFLASHWTTAMIPLNRKAANCEQPALSLAVR